MEEGSLSPQQRQVITTFRTAVGRLGVPDIVPPATLKTVEDLAAFLDGAAPAFKKTRRAMERELATAQAIVAAAPRTGGVDENAWRRLEETCRKVEQELRAPPTLRVRIDEGRRSMVHKVEKVVRERLEPEVSVVRGAIEGGVAKSGLEALKQELPAWVGAWSRYSLQWLDVDIQRAVDELWNSREGPLPVPAPNFAAFETTALDISPPELPVIRLSKGKRGLLSGVYRSARTVLYGFMSFTFLFGLRGNEEAEEYLPWLAGLVAFIAVIFGIVQAFTDRAKEIEEVEKEVHRKAEQATWEAVRNWLDRAADKVGEDIRQKLYERRMAFVDWYRNQVLPARSRRKDEAAKRGAAADTARKQLVSLQTKQRDLQKAKAELARLHGFVAG